MNRRGFLAILAGAPIAAKMEPAVIPAARLTGGINRWIATNAVGRLTATEATMHPFDALRYSLVDQVRQKIVPVSKRWMEELNRGTFD